LHNEAHYLQREYFTIRIQSPNRTKLRKYIKGGNGEEEKSGKNGKTKKKHEKLLDEIEDLETYLNQKRRSREVTSTKEK